MTIILDGTTGITNNSGTLISATTVGVGGATPAASGAGITFPATQSASTDANTLDDYEEGTWTPTQQVALTVVGTFSSNGKYTKIGRMVYLSGSISGSTSIAFTGGSLILGGLPFNAITAPQQTGTGITSTTTVTAIMLAYNASIYAGNSVSATSSFDFNIAYQV
jgi:hypothetical protein